MQLLKRTLNFQTLLSICTVQFEARGRAPRALSHESYDELIASQLAGEYLLPIDTRMPSFLMTNDSAHIDAMRIRNEYDVY
jgi:hypothetical protein